MFNIKVLQVRNDEVGNIIEMAKNFIVNHWGTILSLKKFKPEYSL